MSWSFLEGWLVTLPMVRLFFLSVLWKQKFISLIFFADINKFLWMVRIGGSTPEGKNIKENDYYTPSGEFRVDKDGSSTLLNCLMYKLCYYRFGQVYTEGGNSLIGKTFLNIDCFWNTPKSNFWCMVSITIFQRKNVQILVNYFFPFLRSSPRLRSCPKCGNRKQRFRIKCNGRGLYFRTLDCSHL